MMLAGSYGLSAHASGAAVDPYAFFVGRVVRSFAEGPEATGGGGVTASQLDITVDLERYIDRSAKRIQSVTGEVLWDYAAGVSTVNTPTAQGATGALSAVPEIELDDVIIRSGNPFATIVVVSLDGKPIASSGLLLIQAVTEDKPYGFVSQPVADENGDPAGQFEIVDLGENLLNVRTIDATVVLKGDAAASRQNSGEPLLSTVRDAKCLRIGLGAVQVFSSPPPFTGDGHDRQLQRCS